MKFSTSGRAVTAITHAVKIDAEVGRRMRERREALRLTQTCLAARLGVSFSQIQKYERGVNRIGAGRLYQVAEALGVPVASFFSAITSSEAGAVSPVWSASEAELTSLSAEFVSIADAETRASVVEFVRSLSAAEGLAVPRGQSSRSTSV